MKTITYNPETHVLVPRAPTRFMAALGWDSAVEHGADNIDINDTAAIYRAMIAAAPQPAPNHNWCAGCSPDNCSGCGAAPAAYIAPQPDRTAELEQLRQQLADSRHERDICHAECIKLTNEYNSQLAAKDEVIAEAGEMLAMRDGQLAALKAELREICAAIDDPACDLTLTAVECIKKLKAESESLRKDAERYRWLRDVMSKSIGGGVEVNDAALVYETSEPGEEVRVYWYPDTPIGFYDSKGSTLDEAILFRLHIRCHIFRNTAKRETY